MVTRDHHPSSLPHHDQVAGRGRELSDQDRLEGSDHLPVRADDLPHHLRLKQLAAVRQGAVGVEHLQGCRDIVALPDPGLYRFAFEHRLAERVLLPRVGGDDSRSFTRQIDPSRRTEAVLVSPIRQSSDPEALGDLIEERVAGVCKPGADGLRAKAGAIPIPESGSTDRDVGMRCNDGSRTDPAVRQRTRPRHQLVG